MLIPAPRNARDLFEALRLYDAQTGIGKFLDLFDLAGVSPRQSFYAVLGRLPAAQGARPPPDYHPKRHMKALIEGEEFQKRLMALLLDAYPEKKRRLLVHIPKCAGSDLTSILMKQQPAFNFRLIDRSWMPGEKMFVQLRKLVNELPYADHVFVHGHVHLKYYLANKMLRFGDEVFTIVRNPADMVVSKINYILTRFTRDPELKAVDTRDWLRFIDHDQLKAAIASGDFRAIGTQILHNPKLIERNPICQHLGEGTAASALDLCARADIEIAHVDRYEEWLLARWGVGASTRNNASKPLVSLDMLGSDATRRADELADEDRIFVEKIQRRLQQTGRCFVMGTELDS